MERITALQIIEALADGVDPFTGDELPQGSAVQNVQVVRALFFAISAIKLFSHDQHTVENQEDISRSEQESLWIEYCQLVKDEAENDINISEYVSDEDEEIYEYEMEDDDTYEYYDKDYEDSMNDLRQELYDDAESYARSDEEGWFYQNSEGSWEDNISNED